MTETGDRGRLLAGVLIAAGVLWLLVASGFIPRRLVLTLIGFWPLLPIGIGLDMLFERKPFDLPFTALALLAMVLLALVLPPGGSAIESRFVEPMDGALRAEVQLELSSSPTTLRPLVGSDLFRADIVDTREIRYRSSGREQRRIALAPGARAVGRSAGDPPHWDLRLATGLPLTLTIDAGSGTVDLDLSGVQLDSLAFDGGSGGLRAALPSSGEQYQASFDLGSGGSVVATDPGADLALEMRGGSGDSRWEIARGTRVAMHLDIGSGDVDIDLPDDAAIVVRIEDDGSGRVALPPFLERTEGSGERGEWRTRNAAVEPEITVLIRDSGSGDVTLR